MMVPCEKLVEQMGIDVDRFNHWKNSLDAEKNSGSNPPAHQPASST